MSLMLLAKAKLQAILESAVDDQWKKGDKVGGVRGVEIEIES